MARPILLWFTRDLRLADHPALVAAVRTGRPIAAVFVLDDVSPGSWARGAASRWFLAGALESLAGAIAARGGRLLLRRGPADRAVAELARALEAEAVHWTRGYDATSRRVEEQLTGRLAELGIAARSFPGFTIHEPEALRQRDGEPYRVYTPFSRAWLEHEPPERPLPVPERLRFLDPGIASETIESLALRPTTPDWAVGLRATWDACERGAEVSLERFLDGPIWSYGRARDFPGRPGVSRLSPHLAIGTISPRRTYWAARARAEALGRDFGAAWPFLRQLVWREFAWSNLFHFPDLPDRPLRPEFGLGYGTPIDRYYINDFLQKYRGDIKGRVLELSEPGYTKSLGGEQVTHSDVLHAVPGNPMATIVADLTDAPQLSSDAYDCVILTQTLNVIYDVRAVLATVHRILKPDGVVLITVPGISQISRTDYEQWGDYWRFTSYTLARLFAPLDPVVVPQHTAYQTLLVLLEPVLNPIWVALVTTERPNPATMIGGVAILATLVAHQQRKQASQIVSRPKRDASNWKWISRWERMQR